MVRSKELWVYYLIAYALHSLVVEFVTPDLPSLAPSQSCNRQGNYSIWFVWINFLSQSFHGA